MEQVRETEALKGSWDELSIKLKTEASAALRVRNRQAQALALVEPPPELTTDLEEILDARWILERAAATIWNGQRLSDHLKESLNSKISYLSSLGRYGEKYVLSAAISSAGLEKNDNRGTAHDHFCDTATRIKGSYGEVSWLQLELSRASDVFGFSPC
jgi:hypothetical protein